MFEITNFHLKGFVKSAVILSSRKILSKEAESPSDFTLTLGKPNFLSREIICPRNVSRHSRNQPILG